MTPALKLARRSAAARMGCLSRRFKRRPSFSERLPAGTPIGASSACCTVPSVSRPASLLLLFYASAALPSSPLLPGTSAPSTMGYFKRLIQRIEVRDEDTDPSESHQVRPPLDHLLLLPSPLNCWSVSLLIASAVPTVVKPRPGCHAQGGAYLGVVDVRRLLVRAPPPPLSSASAVQHLTRR